MRILLRLFGIIETLLICIYLLNPSPQLPNPPPGSLVSLEPGDTETIYRHAFYTDLSRSEVMDYYTSQLKSKLQFVLILPPEDAGAVIRDQTRSSYLEEIVHPLKQSIYVNGFVPTKPEEIIIRDNKIYSSKITVHIVPTTLTTRFTVFTLTLLLSYLLIKEYRHA